tara:strand:+ start:324 stop:836 length:513 start_codon:yes stop_codon:yes gene_type:complete
MYVPITKACSEVRGLSPHDGYANIQLNMGWLDGQLSKIVASNINDPRKDKILIFVKTNMFDCIKENDLMYLSKIDDPIKYADRLEKMLESIDTLIENKKELLFKHDLIEFHFDKWDNPTISAETWLNSQCKRMREMGLIVQVGDQQLPESLLRSMGARLVGRAKKDGVLS